MNASTQKAMFSSATDEWSTPQDFYEALNREFGFQLDAAAAAENAKCDRYLDSEIDSLQREWHTYVGPVWLNPPYSRLKDFLAKAAAERLKGVTTVVLMPSRTDTRAWHDHIWDIRTHQPRPGIETRFLKGRLKFGGSKNSAPFPSVVVVFRGAQP